MAGGGISIAVTNSLHVVLIMVSAYANLINYGGIIIKGFKAN